MSKLSLAIVTAVAGLVLGLVAIVSSLDDEPVSQQRPSITVEDFGDDAQLDRLWVVCSTGNGSACQELLDLAPPLSEYASFAIESGARR